MSRARLYVLIDAFEQDMRAIVERYLLDHMSVEDVLSPREVEIARARQSSDSNGEEVSIVHYLDLQACFDVLLRNRQPLPHELVDELTSNAPVFSQLVPVRHRVFHGRPLNDDDPSKAIALLAAFVSRYWGETSQVLARLGTDATWEPYFEKLPLPFERTLHNLPEVDYDETTFIGRKPEATKLLDDLRRRRHSVITVTGEGGIGKTALALDVAYRLVDGEDNPFDAVLWVSLKTEKLTAFGVEVLKDAIRGFDDTVVALGQGLASDFSGSLEDLAAALDGIECLIIIDNLESAQGDEVVAMYDALPTSVNYLFTSRLGIGQLERRFPLPPLSGDESKLLLRKFASARQLKKLVGLSDTAMDHVVEHLRHSPLAIRWYVLSSEAGRVPLDTLRNQQELLDFCVRNVYEGLSENSKAVLTVLRALDRSIGFDEFAILTDMTIDELRGVTQELTRGSLVVVEAEAVGAIAGRLALTPTARSFLPRPDHNGSFITAVLQRERQFKASIEQEFSSGSRAIAPEIVRSRDAHDHPAMFLLQTSLTLAKSKQFTKAHSNIERAKAFNPEFSEVYRVSGHVYGLENNNETAVAEYQVAVGYGTDPVMLATASHALADIMSRRLHDSTLALPHARRAYNLLPCGDTAFMLGKLLVWTNQFDEGQGYVLEALDSASGRHHLVVSTVLVDSWGRWAESELRGRRYTEAFEKAAAGYHNGQSLIGTNIPDARLVDAMVECCIQVLRASMKITGALSTSEERVVESVSKFLTTWAKSIPLRKLPYVRDAITSVLANSRYEIRTRESLSKASRALPSR